MLLILFLQVAFVACKLFDNSPSRPQGLPGAMNAQQEVAEPMEDPLTILTTCNVRKEVKPTWEEQSAFFITSQAHGGKIFCRWGEPNIPPNVGHNSFHIETHFG